jgi:hypothetical protein
MLDENLTFLKEHLVPSNFDRALSSLWSVCASSVSAVTDRGIADKYSASRFAQLYHAFRTLLKFFFDDSLPADDPGLPARILRTLKLYACCDVDALVLHYFSTRYIQQQQASSYPHGSVTVRAMLQSAHLRVEVLNARHLKPAELLSRENKDGCSKSARSNLDLFRELDSLTSTPSTISSASSFSTYPRRVRRPLPPPRGGTETAVACLQDLYPLPLPPVAPQETKSESRMSLLWRCYPTPNSQPLSSEPKFDFLQSKLDSVRLTVQETHVVMNRNFGATGHCNPYVTVRLVPAAKFASLGVKKVRTKIQPRTLFPL